MRTFGMIDTSKQQTKNQKIMKDRFHFFIVGFFLITALFGFTQLKDATEYQSRVLRHVVS